ncbi:unnamed protein product [Closterium sp. NIES-65]|nr:unnamed protein product [Closterium sp. NIES-65]
MPQDLPDPLSAADVDADRHCGPRWRDDDADTAAAFENRSDDDVAVADLPPRRDTASAEPALPRCDIMRLPPALLARVMRRVDFRDRIAASMTCSTWRLLASAVPPEDSFLEPEPEINYVPGGISGGPFGGLSRRNSIAAGGRLFRTSSVASAAAAGSGGGLARTSSVAAVAARGIPAFVRSTSFSSRSDSASISDSSGIMSGGAAAGTNAVPSLPESWKDLPPDEQEMAASAAAATDDGDISWWRSVDGQSWTNQRVVVVTLPAGAASAKESPAAPLPPAFAAGLAPRLAASEARLSGLHASRSLDDLDPRAAAVKSAVASAFAPSAHSAHASASPAFSAFPHSRSPSASPVAFRRQPGDVFLRKAAELAGPAARHVAASACSFVGVASIAVSCGAALRSLHLSRFIGDVNAALLAIAGKCRRLQELHVAVCPQLTAIHAQAQQGEGEASEGGAAGDRSSIGGGSGSAYIGGSGSGPRRTPRAGMGGIGGSRGTGAGGSGGHGGSGESGSGGNGGPGGGSGGGPGGGAAAVRSGSLSALVNGCRQLTCLSLTGCRVGHAQAEVLIRGMKQRLLRLEVAMGGGWRDGGSTVAMSALFSSVAGVCLTLLAPPSSLSFPLTPSRPSSSPHSPLPFPPSTACCPSIERLLVRTTLKVSDGALASLLASCPRLTHLHFAGERLTPKGYSVWSRLLSLSIPSAYFSDGAIDALRALAPASSPPSSSQPSSPSHPPSSPSLPPSSPSLPPSSPSNPPSSPPPPPSPSQHPPPPLLPSPLWSLHSLTMDNCRRPEVIPVIARLAPGLRHVRMKHVAGLTDDLLADVGRCCPGLASLDVSFCSAITSCGISSLIRACTQLESLTCQVTGASPLSSSTLSACSPVVPMDIQALATLVACCPRLTSVSSLRPISLHILPVRVPLSTPLLPLLSSLSSLSHLSPPHKPHQPTPSLPQPTTSTLPAFPLYTSLPSFLLLTSLGPTLRSLSLFGHQSCDFPDINASLAVLSSSACSRLEHLAIRHVDSVMDWAVEAMCQAGSAVAVNLKKLSLDGINLTDRAMGLAAAAMQRLQELELLPAVNIGLSDGSDSADGMDRVDVGHGVSAGAVGTQRRDAAVVLSGRGVPPIQGRC